MTLLSRPPASAKPVPVLEEVGVHDERLAGAGRALEGDGAKVVRGVVGHPLRLRVLALRLVQIGAEALRIGEVAVQVVLGEQQGEVLVGLPRPGHAPRSCVARGSAPRYWRHTRGTVPASTWVRVGWQYSRSAET